MYGDYKIKPLHKILPKTKAHVKGYDDQTKWIYFLIENDDLLWKCNTVWDKAGSDIEKRI